MRYVSGIRNVKFVLGIVAVLIVICSLIVSNILVKDLSYEETKKMEIWSEAMKAFSNAGEDTDVTLVLKILNANNTIPVIVLDKDGNVQNYRNIEIPLTDGSKYLDEKKEEFKRINHKIRIYFQQDSLSYKSDYIDVYYDESLMLKRLAIYPYVQLGILATFIFIIIIALLNYKKSEQNKVWVGLSKETAHQLGTPISSLMAWLEILKERYSKDELIQEMGSDVYRLQLVADRFSKIGSMAEPVSCNLEKVLDDVIDYMSRRCSNKAIFVKKYIGKSIYIDLNSSLFEWVIENLCKNALDAIQGNGEIVIDTFIHENKVIIDISDTGKGIAKSKYKTVFKPGYTTKNRGWGLGLSLAKRIIEEYHDGHIFVKRSDLNKGTTFRIELKK